MSSSGQGPRWDSPWAGVQCGSARFAVFNDTDGDGAHHLNREERRGPPRTADRRGSRASLGGRDAPSKPSSPVWARAEAIPGCLGTARVTLSYTRRKSAFTGGEGDPPPSNSRLRPHPALRMPKQPGMASRDAQPGAHGSRPGDPRSATNDLRCCHAHLAPAPPTDPNEAHEQRGGAARRADRLCIRQQREEVGDAQLAPTSPRAWTAPGCTWWRRPSSCPTSASSSSPWP